MSGICSANRPFSTLRICHNQTDPLPIFHDLGDCVPVCDIYRSIFSEKMTDSHLKPDAIPVFEQSEGVHSPRQIIGSLIRAASKKRMTSLSTHHLAAGRKQLAVFAFDSVSLNINEDGIFERHELEAFFDWMKACGVDFSTSTALDIGANIGNHALFFSDYFKVVHCFEPAKRTFSVLKVNASLAENIVCHNVGLSSISRNATLTNPHLNVGGASVVDGEDGEKITLVRLDDIDLATNDIRLIKIDVEGHEYEALSGAKETILRHKPIILFEQLPQEIYKMTSRTVDLLKSFGYVKFAVLDRTPLPPSFVPRRLHTLSVLIQKLFTNSGTRISITVGFEQKFYPFVVAIPSWLQVGV